MCPKRNFGQLNLVCYKRLHTNLNYGKPWVKEASCGNRNSEVNGKDNENLRCFSYFGWLCFKYYIFWFVDVWI